MVALARAALEVAVAFTARASLTDRLLRVRHLVLKELKEHGWVLLALLLLFGVGLGVQLARADDEGGRFVALRSFVIIWGTLAALVAGNRLVVREYTGKTQLFLEALPIGRARVVWTKWLVGLGWVEAVTVAAWGATWWFMARSTALDVDDALYALAPALLWMALLWSVCFAAGLLGRYRLLFWIVAGLVAFGLDQVGQVQLSELPPLGLLSERLAVAGAWPRWEDTLAALVGLVVATTAGVVLATAGEGSIVTTLSGRMTSRERLAAISTMLVGFLLFTALAKERARPAFSLEAVTPKASEAGPIGVLPGEGVSEAQAQALAEAVAVDVVTFTRAVGYPPLAGVYVVAQRGLDPDVLIRAPLGERDGIVMQANLADPRFDVVNLRYRILHSVVGDHTKNRGLEEDRHWLLDGLTAYWVVRDDAEARALQRRRAAAAPFGLSMRALSRWDETFERAGDCFGMALSFTLVDALVEELGEAKVLDVFRRVFVQPRGDVRDVLFETKLPKALADEGVDLERLLARAEAARRNVGTPPSRYEGTVELVDQGGGQRRAAFTLRRDGAPVTRFRGLYASVGPWQAGMGDTELSRVDARQATVLAPGVFASGERLFFAIEVDDEALRCSARVYQDWRVLP